MCCAFRHFKYTDNSYSVLTVAVTAIFSNMNGTPISFCCFMPTKFGRVFLEKALITIPVLPIACCKQKVRRMDERSKWKQNTSNVSECTLKKNIL